MYLLVSGELINLLQKEPREAGEVWGSSSDRRSAVRLLSATRRPGLKKLGYWQRNGVAEPDKLPSGGRPGQVLLVLRPEGIACYRLGPDRVLEALPFEVSHLYADYHARIEGLFDRSVLPDKQVVIVGLGSGGAAIASDLARAGVGRFKLVDFDRLKTHNIARHVCGLNDLGRYKVEAVRDYLQNTSLVARIETYRFDVTSDPARLEEIISGADLVIGATDSEAAKSSLNRAAWKQGIPAVYGAAYDLGFGGDVFLADPPAGACYECFRRGTDGLFRPPEDLELDYGRNVAQPALGIDVRFISLIAARMALTRLLRDDPSARLAALPSNWVLWGNWVQPGWVFDKPLQSDFVQVDPDPLCPVCHPEAYSQAYLGMTPEEARAKAAALLEQLPSL